MKDKKQRIEYLEVSMDLCIYYKTHVVNLRMKLGIEKDELLMYMSVLSENVSNSYLI